MGSLGGWSDGIDDDDAAGRWGHIDLGRSSVAEEDSTEQSELEVNNMLCFTVTPKPLHHAFEVRNKPQGNTISSPAHPADSSSIKR